MVWKPHVTVSAIVEHEQRFLLVEERVDGRMVLNNPAGHLEPGETLLQAVIRETREEAAWEFTPEAVIGIYQWHHAPRDLTFLRVCYCGAVNGHDPEQHLDEGIHRTIWMTRDEMLSARERLRSPMVLQAIDDYLAGTRYPLDIIKKL